MILKVGRCFLFDQLIHKEKDMLGSLIGLLCTWVQVGGIHHVTPSGTRAYLCRYTI